MSGFSVFGRHHQSRHPWNGSSCYLKYFENVNGISPCNTFSLFTVSQSVLPKLFPSPETMCTFVNWIVLGLTLCVLLFVYLDPLDLHSLAKWPTLSQLWHFTVSALHSPFLWIFHTFDIWIDHYYQTAFLLHWWMLLPCYWILVHLLVMLHKTCLYLISLCWLLLFYWF